MRLPLSWVLITLNQYYRLALQEEAEQVSIEGGSEAREGAALARVKQGETGERAVVGP